MPRRTTLTYSSEDAPTLLDGERELFVYYCKYSGKHALTTDCDLAKAPRRRTDRSSVIDTQKHLIRLYTSEGGCKLIKRASGVVEKQYRLNVGKLPVAYRPEPEARFLYVLHSALTSYSVEDKGLSAGKAPVPPCIQPHEGGTQISMEVDDRAAKADVVKVSADQVRCQVTLGISHEGVGEELLEFMRGVLNCRLAQMSLKRGESTRHKLLVLEQMSPAAVFQKLQEYVARKQAGVR